MTRTCCFILDQNDLTTGCPRPAEYEIWAGDHFRDSDCTDSCASHVSELLSDETRHLIVAIDPQEARADGAVSFSVDQATMHRLNAPVDSWRKDFLNTPPHDL